MEYECNDCAGVYDPNEPTKPARPGTEEVENALVFARSRVELLIAACQIGQLEARREFPRRLDEALRRVKLHEKVREHLEAHRAATKTAGPRCIVADEALAILDGGANG